MKKRSLFLLVSALLIVSADLAYLYGRGGGGGGRAGGFGGGRGMGGGGRSMGGGSRGMAGGGRSFSGGNRGMSGARYSGSGARAGAGRAGTSRPAGRPGSRPGNGSRPGSGSRPGQGNRDNQGNRNVNKNVNRNWNHGGYGYWRGGYGGYGWGAFGLGLYLPLTLAAAYGIANSGGSSDTTIINNYPPTQDYDASQNENYDYDAQAGNGGEYVPKVPQDAVFISPEMMNDPQVKKALAAMRSQQGEDLNDASTDAALQKARTALKAKS
ncbi:MAG: hypothetical protein K2X90_01115 [Candidatus Babeliaceae bacterium]|nr:hypothetical protein [Candidatus Babeliaceae bacterium]